MFLQVIGMKTPSQQAKYPPQGDHKRISFQHSELQPCLSIGKVCYPDSMLSSFANCIVGALPRGNTIGKFPDIFDSFSATS
jgi:hypothetical protein